MNNDKETLDNYYVTGTKDWDEHRRKEAAKYLRWAQEHLDYADNFRFARLDNEEEMRAFAEATNNGCCGYHAELRGGGRRAFLAGCNYGH